MKATLEFDLDDFSDKKAHLRAIAATDAFLALYDIDNMLKEYSKGIDVGDVINVKDGPHRLNDFESELLHRVCEIIRGNVADILDVHGVNMGYLE